MLSNLYSRFLAFKSSCLLSISSACANKTRFLQFFSPSRIHDKICDFGHFFGNLISCTLWIWKLIYFFRDGKMENFAFVDLVFFMPCPEVANDFVWKMFCVFRGRPYVTGQMQRHIGVACWLVNLQCFGSSVTVQTGSLSLWQLKTLPVCLLIWNLLKYRMRSVCAMSTDSSPKITICCFLLLFYLWLSTWSSLIQCLETFLVLFEKCLFF